MKIRTIRNKDWKSLAPDAIKKYIPILMEHFNWNKPNPVVLDYGCGCGSIAMEYLLPKVNQVQGQLFCVDKSAHAILSARTTYQDSRKLFIRGDILIEDKPWALKDQKFDLVLAFDVLQQVDDLRMFFRKMYAQLNTGGQIGAMLPLDVTLLLQIRKLLLKIPDIGTKVQNAFPVYAEWAKGIGSAQFVRGMAMESGFKIIYFDIVQTCFTYDEVECLSAHYLSFLNETMQKKLEDDEVMERLEDNLAVEIRRILNVPPKTQCIANVGHNLVIVMEKQ